jgi:multidrug resistance efflux pump
MTADDSRQVKKGDRLAQIRALYFRATRATILRDFDTAIDLIKSMESEAEREKATVYMQGLAEMRKEFGFARKPAKR